MRPFFNPRPRHLGNAARPEGEDGATLSLVAVMDEISRSDSIAYHAAPYTLTYFWFLAISRCVFVLRPAYEPSLPLHLLVTA